MKNVFLTVSALTFLGAAAQAQMVFDGGEISANALFPTSSSLSGAAKYGIAGNAAVSFGSIGIQADFGYDTAQGGPISSSFYVLDTGVHAYYKFSNTFKAGAFYTNESLGDGGGGGLDFTLTTYGAEALFDLGKLDIEISIGGSGGELDTAFIISADGYYQVSDAFEVNAGIWVYGNNTGGGNNLTIATVGANYSLANVPVTLGISYSSGFLSSGGASGGGSISAKVSYDFGTGNGQRLFSSRNFDYLDLIFSLNGP